MTRLANSKHCFICGLENDTSLKLVLESPVEGQVTGKFSIPSQFQGWPGIVHGGILASIMDEAGGRTAETGKIPKHVYLTGSMTVRYRHPAKCDTPLEVVAELVSRKGRVVKSTSRILDETGLVLAEAENVYIQLANDLGIDHSGNRDEWIIEGEGSDDQ